MDTETLFLSLQKVKELARLIEGPMESYLLATVDETLREPILHQIRSGGKRIRPGMVLLTCLAVNGHPDDAVPAAAAIEILHNYSLIIDDIIDDASTRRGRLTTWKKYGLHVGLLCGILHREAAFLAMQDTMHPQIIESWLSKSICDATTGEILDLKYTFKESVIHDDGINRTSVITIENYKKLIWLKTAQFFGIACKIGALEGGADEEQQRLARQYGESVGLAFQIMDDVLDLKGDPSSLGKESGKDLKEGKLGNFPLLIAFLEMKEDEKAMILDILRRGAERAGDIDNVMRMIEKYKGFDRALETAHQHVAEAKKAIQDFPNQDAVKMLQVLAEYVIFRHE